MLLIVGKHFVFIPLFHFVLTVVDEAGTHRDPTYKCNKADKNTNLKIARVQDIHIKQV